MSTKTDSSGRAAGALESPIPRRYLTEFSAFEHPQRLADVLVIGSGIAGLTAAITASRYGKVLVIAKGDLDRTATDLAQGGIAIANGPDDSVEKHVRDTIDAGRGIADEEVVGVICREGPARLADLVEWGVRFDRQGEAYSRHREGGHSTARVLHVGGDLSGHYIEKALIERAATLHNVKLLPSHFAIDLITRDGDGVCIGVLLLDDHRGREIIWARRVILATGGAGQIFRETTNPETASGDGIAMAFRAGAKLADLEFVQFHPTTLYVAGAIRALISEAVRGEGATLQTRSGRRFMRDYHESAELAPRDIVSRAIVSELKKTGETCVYLDMTHLKAEAKKRFPQIAELCGMFAIDIARDRIPVRPSAHYLIGGIRTDLTGATSVPNLYAVGECACAGFHGANRLASNSLLEGLVMGHRAGEAVGRALSDESGEFSSRAIEFRISNAPRPPIILSDVENSLRALMWRFMGIERNGPGLKEALESIKFWRQYIERMEFQSPEGWRLQNMLLVARLMTECALARTESRGAHYRTDFPEQDDANSKRHTEVVGIREE